MSETRYYLEYLFTGSTNRYSIEDLIYFKKPVLAGSDTLSNIVGIGKVPLTQLDVEGQIRLTSGTTNYEGEIRYKDTNLWVNTGGTSNTWVPLTSTLITNNVNDYVLTAVGLGNNIINGENSMKITPTSTSAGNSSTQISIGNYNNINLLLYPQFTVGDMNGSAVLKIITTITGDTSSSYIDFIKFENINKGYELGRIKFSGTDSTVPYTGAAIFANATETFNHVYGTELIIQTTANGEDLPKDRIVIQSGNTYIDNGDFYVTNGVTDLNGSFCPPFEVVTTGTTLDDTHYTVVVSSSSDQKITLPTAASRFHRIYTIKRSGSGNVNITRGGIDNIVVTSGAGVPSVNITTDGYAITLQSDGNTKWYIIGAVSSTSY